LIMDFRRSTELHRHSRQEIKLLSNAANGRSLNKTVSSVGHSHFSCL
jgi:hypothetical protein